MKKKISMVFVAVFVCMAVVSNAFAVTYTPNRNDNIVKDNIVALDEKYTQEDVNRVLEIYFTNASVTEEELEKYDLNGDQLINCIDAALIRNYISK